MDPKGTTGPGLLMIRKVIAEHTGRLEIESMQGQGTTCGHPRSRGEIGLSRSLRGEVPRRQS